MGPEGGPIRKHRRRLSAVSHSSDVSFWRMARSRTVKKKLLEIPLHCEAKIVISKQKKTYYEERDNNLEDTGGDCSFFGESYLPGSKPSAAPVEGGALRQRPCRDLVRKRSGQLGGDGSP